jgi:hypothetical protein
VGWVAILGPPSKGVMVDKVKPLKYEDATSGTESDVYATETNPTEDYLACKGIAFENSDTKYVSTNGSGNLIFKDPSTGSDLTLSDFITLPATAFAPSYQYAESLAESTTTSTTYQNKLTLTTPTLAAGDYRIAWGFDFSIDTNDRSIQYRVQVDNTTTLSEAQTYSSFAVDGANGSGFAKVTLTNATHFIDIDYRRSSASSSTVRIKNARIDIWRLS